MNVLLINPPIREKELPNCFPLGLAYIARVLIDNNHKVDVLDVNAYRYSRYEVEDDIRKRDCDVYGITGLVTQYSYIKYLCKVIKRYYPKRKIIVGGNIASTMAKLMLEKTEADIMVIGEGEVTAVELIYSLEQNKDLTSVKGLAFRQDEKIVTTAPREPIADIDTIPFPAWELFPLEKYIKNSVTDYKKTRNIAILTSRGCPFRCIFCYDTFGKKTRFRSPENVIAEIKELQKRYSINRISPYDETFTVNRQRAMDIYNLVIREKLNITWDCSGRVNCIDEELLMKLKQAGVTYILYGIESGSQTILNEMQKGVSVEQASKAIRMTRKVGIEMVTPLMIGFPSESKATIDESVAFFTKENIYPGVAFFPTPHPGAPLYDWAIQKGLITNEEKYIEQLGEFVNLHVNLTSMTDEELIKLKKSAEKRNFRNYIIKNWYIIPLRAFSQLRTLGFRGFLKNIRDYILILLPKNA